MAAKAFKRRARHAAAAFKTDPKVQLNWRRGERRDGNQVLRAFIQVNVSPRSR